MRSSSPASNLPASELQNVNVNHVPVVLLIEPRSAQSRRKSRMTSTSKCSTEDGQEVCERAPLSSSRTANRPRWHSTPCQLLSHARIQGFVRCRCSFRRALIRPFLARFGFWLIIHSLFDPATIRAKVFLRYSRPTPSF